MTELKYTDELKIAAFDTAADILRTPISQWIEENPDRTKEQRVRQVIRETYLTIEELK